MSMSFMGLGSLKPFQALLGTKRWSLPPPGDGLRADILLVADASGCSNGSSLPFFFYGSARAEISLRRNIQTQQNSNLTSKAFSSDFSWKRTRTAALAAPPTEALHGSGAPELSAEEAPAKDSQFSRIENESLLHKDFSSEGISRRLPLLQVLQRKVLRQLSSFSLAIGELFAIAALSALGTIIEQGESTEFYMQSYSEENPVLGFLTWRWILGLSLDHIYTAPYFLGLLILLAASLMACTSTRQLPMVKVARRWSFIKSSSQLRRMDVSDTLHRARLTDFGTLLVASGYEVFARGPTLYAFKGIAGKLAPIGVHAALLLIMGGATISAIGGFRGSVMIPQGLQFNIGDALVANGFLSVPSPTMNLNVNVNNFFIDYLPSGEVAQFYSDLSIVDYREKEILRKTINVNSPLRFEGVTIYQTDWRVSAVQVYVDGSEPFNLVMAPLQKGDAKLFGTFLPLGDEGLLDAKGISILARDLQSVAIYDKEGKFVGIRRPGSNRSIVVNGVNIIVEDIIGSTGLELKIDPGVPVVYAGFGALMLTTCISFLSHSQVWALQEGTTIVVGGKSNRAKLMFERELNELLDSVPEIISKTPSYLSDQKDSLIRSERLANINDVTTEKPLFSFKKTNIKHTGTSH
ncbi:hypothetical protein O6H91_Y209800 [Diphasiastrum complanatum]|nr:hypothetical protein O6H91_Y209800 [Diphasiastrum complanatum]